MIPPQGGGRRGYGSPTRGLRGASLPGARPLPMARIAARAWTDGQRAQPSPPTLRVVRPLAFATTAHAMERNP